MELNPLVVWIPFLLLTLVARRLRRLRVRLPLVGFLGLLGVASVYAGWRLGLHRGPWTYTDALRLHALLVAAGSFALLPLLAWLRALWRQDLRRLGRVLRRDAVWTVGCVLAALVAADLYFFFGTRLAARGVLEGYDTLFWSDPGRYTHIFNGTALEEEQVTHKHPLVPLVGQAAFRLAVPVVGPAWAPLAVSSAAGGLCVALAARSSARGF